MHRRISLPTARGQRTAAPPLLTRARAPSSLLPPHEPHLSPQRRISPCKDPLHGQRWHFSSRSQHARPLVRESTLRPDPAKVCAAADFEFLAKETAPTEAPAPPAWFNLHEPARPDVQNTSCEEGAISLTLYPHHLQVILFCLRRHGSRTLHQQRQEDQSQVQVQENHLDPSDLLLLGSKEGASEEKPGGCLDCAWRCP